MSSDHEDTDLELRNNLDRIEVTGRMSRTDWEDMYFLAQELAQKHGLTVEGFELQPATPEDAEDVSKHPVDAQEAAADPK